MPEQQQDVKAYKFAAVLKKYSSDEDGEGTLILNVPMTEQHRVTGLNMECKRILNVTIEVE